MERSVWKLVVIMVVLGGRVTINVEGVGPSKERKGWSWRREVARRGGRGGMREMYQGFYVLRREVPPGESYNNSINNLGWTMACCFYLCLQFIRQFSDAQATRLPVPV